MQIALVLYKLSRSDHNLQATKWSGVSDFVRLHHIYLYRCRYVWLRVIIEHTKLLLGNRNYLEVRKRCSWHRKCVSDEDVHSESNI